MSILADVNIQVGIKSWKRTTEPFLPTANWTTALIYKTDTDAYLSEIGNFAQDTYTNLEAQRAAGAQNTIMVSITVGNTTAAFSGAGVVPMSKQHLDFALSDDEFTSADILQTALNTQVANLITRAKYN